MSDDNKNKTIGYGLPDEASPPAQPPPSSPQNTVGYGDISQQPSPPPQTPPQAYDATQMAAPPQQATTGQATLSGDAGVRRYSDGVMTTLSRERVTTGTQSGIPLPYASSDVIRHIGGYDVLAELGRGGMGVVYRAYSLRLCRPCAIKVILSGGHASDIEIIRFQNEAMLAARLQHPNIVSVFDAGEADGLFYFVMELVEGEPLTALIDHGGEQAFQRGVRALAKAARALDYAHDREIVHRDIKPDNILVDHAGDPHITDFGIAKNIEAEVGMTARGAIMGTPAYMSPEQINGEVAAIGPHSDVYSLGATLYELCTGMVPFPADNPMEVLQMGLTDDPARPRDVARKNRNRDLSLDLETICLKALEKKAQNRYVSAGEFADDLEAYLEDKPIAARPVGAYERLRKSMRRNRSVFVGAAVVFATLLVIGLSFGLVVVFNIEKTSASLRKQDEQAAIDLATTLERSIRVSMLQGRADVVRELVNKLRDAPNISRVDVVRTDRSYAYTDLATRKWVERRLRDPQVRERLARDWPELEDAIAEVQQTAFKRIDNNRIAPQGLYDYDRAQWNSLLRRGKTITRKESIDGTPMLTVLKPIENSRKCQACHGEADDTGYGSNNTRAVLVIQRSQEAVESEIRDNRSTTLIVGVTTASAILGLIWLFARLLGLRMRKERYGAR